MRVLSAMNFFKGSLSSVDATEAVAEGLSEAGIETVMFPLADGGDGTIEVVKYLSGGELVEVEVHDPLGRSIKAHYLRLGQNAVVESARATGIALLKPSKLDPMVASSYGTGELLARALRDGAKRVVLGLGGSATNDGGLGLLVGMGGKATGTREYGGRGLMSVKDIDLSPVLDLLEGRDLIIASDVFNPLLGPNGATRTYGPQKGVTPEMAKGLEKAMARWCAVLERRSGRRLKREPGAGAAGGMGAAALSIGGKLRLGAEIILEFGGFEDRASNCEGLVTGEGKMDGQTRFGRAPVVVARAFRDAGGRRVVGLAGTLGEGYEELRPPFDAFFSITTGPMSLEESMARTHSLLRQTAREIGELLRCSS